MRPAQEGQAINYAHKEDFTDVFPGNENGKIGFVITLIALIAATMSFATMAVAGTSDQLLAITLSSLIVAFVGHFMLDGGEFRKKMLAAKKKRKNKE